MKRKIINITLIILLVNSHLFPFTIFYFNPDSTVVNPLYLVRNFNGYFKQFDENFKLQPFRNIETLLNIAEKENPEFLIIPYFNYVLIKSSHNKKDQMKMSPIIKSTKKNSYKKFFVILNNNPLKLLNEFEGDIATVSYGPKSKNFIIQPGSY